MKQMRIGFDAVQKSIFREKVADLGQTEDENGLKAYGHITGDVATYLFGSYGTLEFCYTKPKVYTDSEAFDLLVISEESSQEKITEIDSFIREYVLNM